MSENCLQGKKNVKETASNHNDAQNRNEWHYGKLYVLLVIGV